MAELGRTLDSAVVEKGLRELNPDIHFDMGTKQGQWHPYQSTRQGVFYLGNHICSMDRGLIPEYKQWSVRSGLVDVPMSEWDHDDIRLFWETVSPEEPGYVEKCIATINGKLENYSIRHDGRLIRLTGKREAKVLGKIVWVGWRHTFEKILLRNIPGVTRSTVVAKFGVDMLKYPMGASGTPEEMLAALHEE